jgi:hypothetical protein
MVVLFHHWQIVSLINPHDICYMAIRDYARTQKDEKTLKNGGKACFVHLTKI